MTIGSCTVPFKSSLHTSCRDMSACPRRTVQFALTSDGATESTPCLVCIPSAPKSFLGLQIIAATFTLATPELVTKSCMFNLCMKLLDGCGRPYGPALPLAAVSFAPGGAAVKTVPICVPLNPGQRVSLFLLSDAPKDVIVRTACIGHAMADTTAATNDERLVKALSRMTKNGYDDSVFAAPVQPAKAKDTPSSPLCGQADSAPKGSSAKKRQRENTEEEIPSLVHAFIPGAADES